MSSGDLGTFAARRTTGRLTADEQEATVGAAPGNGWLLRYDGVDDAQEALREALCSVGNGRFATRAAAPESRADGVHYPGTYAAGVYNRLVDDVAGPPVDNESLVNLPDWQSLTVRIGDGPGWTSPRSSSPTTCRSSTCVVACSRAGSGWRTREGRRTAVTQRRLVSMADPYLAALRRTFVAENWSGDLTVRSVLDGRVANRGVARYRGLGATPPAAWRRRPSSRGW